jgi:hypothetical protein
MKFKYGIGVLLLSISSAVLAEDMYKPGEFYVSPGVAYYHFSEKRDLQNTAMANISAGMVVSDRFSLEAFYGQAAAEESPSALNQNTRFYAYAVEGVYHSQPGVEALIHPYVLAGLNVTNQEDNSTSSGNTTLLGVNAGVGIEYFVNSTISLFTDVRDLYTLSGGKDDWMVNAGIKFVFGGSQPDVASSPVKTDGATGFYQLQEKDTEES